MTKYIFTLLWGIFFPVICHAQDVKQWNTPGTGNPFIPGYFADPTIKKFGDTYYLYATTDGNGNGFPQLAQHLNGLAYDGGGMGTRRDERS